MSSEVTEKVIATANEYTNKLLVKLSSIAYWVAYPKIRQLFLGAVLEGYKIGVKDAFDINEETFKRINNILSENRSSL